MNSSEHYRYLKKELERNKCFENRSSYITKFFIVGLIFLFSYCILLSSSELWVQCLAIFSVAFMSVQAAFLAHEAGDGAVTKSKTLTIVLSQTYMTFFSGLSFSYFIELHKLHHKTMKKGSVIHGNPENIYETKLIKKLVAFNPTIFMVTTILLRGFTLKLEGVKYLLMNDKTNRDFVFLLAHFLFWLVIPTHIIGFIPALINYTMITLFSGLYAGIVLVVNHAGMATSFDVKELPFIERIGTKTRNLPSNFISDIVWGGINNHIEHHLYPSIPSSNLRKARSIVRAYFLENNLPYNESSFSSAVKEARKYFISLSAKERILEPLN